MSQGPAWGDAIVRDTAAEILARPEYAMRRTDEQAWLDLLTRIEEWLAQFEGWMLDLSEAEPLLYWTLLLALLGLAVALLFHVGWSVRAAMRAPAPEAAGDDRGRRRDFLGEGAELAQRGEFLEAARRVHLACLEVLLGSGVIELRRSETNRSLRRAVARAALPPDERRAFGELLDRLERGLFRDGSDDPSLYDGWLTLHRGLARHLGLA